MHPGIESMAFNMNCDNNPLAFYGGSNKNVIVHGRDGNGHWKKKGEDWKLLENSQQQYFLWCCVQQQMYHYQLLSSAFASYGFEPPRIPGGGFHHFPPTFHGTTKCPRDVEVFDQCSFLYVHTPPDGYHETKKDSPFERRNQKSEKSTPTFKKPTCKVLFEHNHSAQLEKAENQRIICNQEGYQIGENSNNLSEHSAQSGSSSQDAVIKHSHLERYLHEEYQVAKNNVNEEDGLCTESTTTSLLKGAFLLSQVLHVSDDQIEPEVPPDLQGPGGHIFLRMLSRSWRQYKRSLEHNE
ncbi:hypothetical protein GpartN1_g2598.t1 [Galdieria partita]|uniref:Uncharacterized protein n=1 Tax=Galdieria partita TaxID=83374 RepID=A0A9C7UPS7_9RHOD|nr:hypothetical protein GpartN1_g2598.t1 [Galdieria partita]